MPYDDKGVFPVRFLFAGAAITVALLLSFPICALSQHTFIGSLSDSRHAYEENSILEAQVYLANAELSLDSRLVQDLEQGLITFEDTRVSLEELPVQQYEIIRTKLVGKRTTWSGWLESVLTKWWPNNWWGSQWWGGFNIHIDMDPPDSYMSIYDVSLSVNADMDQYVRTLQKDEKIEFSGRIVNVQRLMERLIVDLDEVSFQ